MASYGTRRTYAGTRFVPSRWHLQRTVVAALADTRGAFVNAGDGKQLHGELAEHLARLGRDSRFTLE